MKNSPRTPGYPFRYIGPEKLREDAQDFLDKFEVQGNHSTTIEPRTARREDAELLDDRGRRSPLK